MGPTEELAHFVVGYPAAVIPESIIHLGKRCFINFLGVALGASRDPSIDIILKLFEEEGGVARASVIGFCVISTALRTLTASGVT